MTTLHYNVVSSDFENLWAFRTQYESALVDDFFELISRGEDTDFRNMVLADIGCGAGYFLKLLAQRSTFKKFFAVEPTHMLDQVQDRADLTPIEKFCMDGNRFFKLQHVQYDVSVMYLMLHHIPRGQLLDFLRGIFSQTNPGGTALVMTHGSDDAPFPLWPEVFKAASASYLPPWEILQGLFREAGFSDIACVKKTYGDVVIPRDEWLWMVRNRFVSVLSLFSDEEIEEGIRSMHYPDPVVFGKWLYFYKASKTA